MKARDEVIGRLSVRINGQPCAELRSRRDGQLELQYLPEWVAQTGIARQALSVALPVRTEPFGDDVAHPFFAGLLPESTNHRQRLGEILHIAASDDFSLLASIGRDCAGSVSVVPIDAPVIREEDIPEEFDPLDEKRLAELIRDLPVRPLFIDEDGDNHLISLAGVNDKAAVIVVDGVIGLPKNGYPSSHILKTDISILKDSIKVEHFAVRLAGELGMKVPRSRIMTAEGIPFMLVSRYDRVVTQTGDRKRLRRIHQEDFCQAHSLMPAAKFEARGGPGWKDAFQLLDHVDDRAGARLELLSRAFYTYLIANSDGHAKNLSLLHRAGKTSLAPLYDVSCQRAFVADYKRLSPYLTMSVGGEHDPNKLTGEHWDRFAAECGFQPAAVRKLLSSMAALMPAKAAALREAMRGTAADSPRLDIVVADVTARCQAVPGMLKRELDAEPAAGGAAFGVS